MSETATATRTVIVTYDRAEDARQASRALLDDAHLPDPVRLQVQTDRMALAGSPFRRTRARAGAIYGALTVGSALGILGIIAAMSGAIPLSVVLGGLLGLVLGMSYGALVGALAGATELPPRLRRLSRRLAMGKAAVAAEVPASDETRATQALLRFPGADAAL